MEIIRDSFNENDSLLMQHITEARAKETAKYAERSAEKRMKELQTKHEEDQVVMGS